MRLPETPFESESLMNCITLICKLISLRTNTPMQRNGWRSWLTLYDHSLSMSIPSSAWKQNYHMLNEKASKASQIQASISIDDNRYVKYIAEQSKDIALETKKDS